MNYEKELEVCLKAVNSVRDLILEIYNSNDFGTEIKSDDSPVTKADKLADLKIREILNKEFPDYSLLTEESVDDKKRLNNDSVFIVDPIDGTKDFILKNGEFTVDIGLSYKHQAVLGVILVPVSGEIFYAVKGEGAFYLSNKNATPVQIHCSDRLDNLICVMSKCHFNEFEQEIINKYKNKFACVRNVGSTLKGCLIAKGEADYHYRRSEHTKEWDTCAMQIIVEEAGGHLLNYNGEPLVYNREDVYNHQGYVICNRIENFLK